MKMKWFLFFKKKSNKCFEESSQTSQCVMKTYHGTFCILLFPFCKCLPVLKIGTKPSSNARNDIFIISLRSPIQITNSVRTAVYPRRIRIFNSLNITELDIWRKTVLLLWALCIRQTPVVSGMIYDLWIGNSPSNQRSNCYWCNKSHDEYRVISIWMIGWRAVAIFPRVELITKLLNNNHRRSAVDGK